MQQGGNELEIQGIIITCEIGIIITITLLINIICTVPVLSDLSATPASLCFWRRSVVLYVGGLRSFTLACNRFTNIYWVSSLCQALYDVLNIQWEQKSHDVCVQGTYSWSKVTLKLKHEGYKRISRAKGKQRGKQGEGTACGKILSKESAWNSQELKQKHVW